MISSVDSDVYSSVSLLPARVFITSQRSQVNVQIMCTCECRFQVFVSSEIWLMLSNVYNSITSVLLSLLINAMQDVPFLVLLHKLQTLQCVVIHNYSCSISCELWNMLHSTTQLSPLAGLL